MKPKALSLFSGIGGIDLAASLTGFDVIGQVEINPFCQKILTKHAPDFWPNAKLFGDITKVKGEQIGQVEFIFGGFPCQDISSAGKRAGLLHGQRSSLWGEFARLIRELRPRVVLLENVAAITTAHKKAVGEFERQAPGLHVLRDLAELGYDARWGIIPASDTGAPHQRKRWFCVAYAASLRLCTSQECRNNEATLSDSTQRGTAPKQFERSGTPRAAQESAMANADKREAGAYWGERSKKENGGQYADRCFGRVGTNSPTTLTAGERNGFKSTGIKPRLGRTANGLPGGLDYTFPLRQGREQLDWEAPRTVEPRSCPNRKDRLEALGNAVVPQVVLPIMQVIYERFFSD